MAFSDCAGRGSNSAFDEAIAPNAKLKQGDFVVFDRAGRVEARRLIVTADCDLQQKKHARLVTLVPGASGPTWAGSVIGCDGESGFAIYAQTAQRWLKSKG